MNYWLIESPFGTLMLLSDGTALKRLSFIDNYAEFVPEEGWQKAQDTVLENAHSQLQEWFSGTRKNFDLPLAPEGTAFQQAVWQQLQKIPYGTTCSYRSMAEAIGKPTASRAIGAANGKNPIALIIPCHRVIGADGSLTGYAFGVELKKQLLTLEARQKTPETPLTEV